MDGEDQPRVWSSLHVGGVGSGEVPHHRTGTACPAQSCHRCTNHGCLYAEFVRQYWSHPQCD